jgi:hypothetical protein
MHVDSDDIHLLFSTIRTKAAIDELRFQIYYLCPTEILVLPLPLHAD